jgi:hypothetical protein
MKGGCLRTMQGGRSSFSLAKTGSRIMPEAHNTTLVSAIDCPGGGQVWIDGTTLYVAHMNPPAGTSIYDVADPRYPRLLAHVEMPAGYHSHKVRARDGHHDRQPREAKRGRRSGLRRRARHLRRLDAGARS